MALEYPNRLAAAGRVDLIGQGGTPIFFIQRGFVNAILDNGVGDYTLTLETGLFTGLLATNGAIVEIIPDAAGYIATEWSVLTATTFRVRLADQTDTLADTSFSIMVWDTTVPG